MNIPIDRSKWSVASQRSLAGCYDAATLYYEDIAYHCKKCGEPSVFSAVMQQRIYEETQKFIAWQPSLCISCENQREMLLEKINECRLSWQNEKATLAMSSDFLLRWYYLLKEVEKYGRKGSNPSVVIMITKLLRNL
ncbi:zinc-ribbon domain containing protein [Methylocucumis oryzae]|uniref:Probable zinc-binding domain-containing protein n=1 Tax=Methylocucumis oryzae TaxID=1632867 RepID=A0A0F3IM15_9GAMM|nr:zinc-ribbon domain containing protein [Methylocucumis oryzae]KJV07707.1 hypothetical protein VZ94_02940 [Methylocucumis oryzae]